MGKDRQDKNESRGDYWRRISRERADALNTPGSQGIKGESLREKRQRESREEMEKRPRQSKADAHRAVSERALFTRLQALINFYQSDDETKEFVLRAAKNEISGGSPFDLDEIANNLADRAMERNYNVHTPTIVNGASYDSIEAYEEECRMKRKKPENPKKKNFLQRIFG